METEITVTRRRRECTRVSVIFTRFESRARASTVFLLKRRKKAAEKPLRGRARTVGDSSVAVARAEQIVVFSDAVYPGGSSVLPATESGAEELSQSAAETSLLLLLRRLFVRHSSRVRRIVDRHDFLHTDGEMVALVLRRCQGSRFALLELKLEAVLSRDGRHVLARARPQLVALQLDNAKAIRRLALLKRTRLERVAGALDGPDELFFLLLPRSDALLAAGRACGRVILGASFVLQSLDQLEQQVDGHAGRFAGGCALLLLPDRFIGRFRLGRRPEDRLRRPIRVTLTSGGARLDGVGDLSERCAVGAARGAFHLFEREQVRVPLMRFARYARVLVARGINFKVRD